jgi:hypothetical protein
MIDVLELVASGDFAQPVGRPHAVPAEHINASLGINARIANWVEPPAVDFAKQFAAPDALRPVWFPTWRPCVFKAAWRRMDHRFGVGCTFVPQDVLASALTISAQTVVNLSLFGIVNPEYINATNG